jgi:polysaccharide export outer membrane protein
MSGAWGLVGLLMAGAVALAGGAATTDTAEASYRVAPGDVLEILIYAGAEKQDGVTSRVSPAGLITCPLVGDVGVAGLTTQQIASQLRDRLARDYYVDPQVMVNVQEYVGKVYVIGEVKRPGMYGLHERLTVLNACILAGGFTDFASPGRVRVTRVKDGVTRVLRIDLARVQRGKSADIVLEAGDRVDVPSRRF